MVPPSFSALGGCWFDLTPSAPVHRVPPSSRLASSSPWNGAPLYFHYKHQIGIEGTSVLSQLSLNPGKNKFLALHLLRRSITHPHQPEMADGLQMQSIFSWVLAGKPLVDYSRRRGRGYGRLINHDSVLSVVRCQGPRQSPVRCFWAFSLLAVKNSYWQRKQSGESLRCLQYVERTSRYFG